jgi:serine/threonine protein kinase/tetratricopeptide (TPR) repeat protein
MSEERDRIEHEPTMPLRASPVVMLRDGVPCGEQRIGRYRLVELLGEGGMGMVFLAEQREPVQRMVALKLMRSTLAGAIAEARFNAERQALALLSHPNIAAMYDAGATEEGFPFFVMERVEGRSLNGYCDEHRLGIRKRIELFIEICRGVQHAHQKGIIHRDLKPANILVDAGGVPKIIDFGIAKAIDQDRELTQQGAIGTPMYMSPEALTGSDLDTRSDVYSLGVMLYELLAGVLPHNIQDQPVGMIIKLVTEQESAAPRTLYRALPETRRREIAMARSDDERSLIPKLSGDLEWIARKAIARDREERYGSAADLASDLQRHLADEPVSATPPSIRYRAAKFARRHRATVVSAALILVAILAGVVATTIAMVRAQRARSEAQAVSAFLIDLIESASPWNRAKDATVRELLEEAARKVPNELRDQPSARAELMMTIGTSEFHLGHLDSAERLLREAIRLRRSIDGGDTPRVAEALNVLGLVKKHQDRFEDAEILLRESIAIREKVYGRVHGSIARGRFDLATVLALRNKNAEAEAMYRESLALREQLVAKGTKDVDPLDVAMTLNGLGTFLRRNRRLWEAETTIRRGIDIRRRAGNRGYAYASALLDLGNVLAEQQRWTEAEAVDREGYEILIRFVDAADERVRIARAQLEQARAHLPAAAGDRRAGS